LLSSYTPKVQLFRVAAASHGIDTLYYNPIS
jgi:hypothetical protein